MKGKKIIFFIFITIIIQISLTTLCFAQDTGSKLDDINQRINVLEQIGREQKIASDFFQSIIQSQNYTLTLQTGIFSIIVIITLSLIALINWRTRKTELEEAIKKMRSQIKKEFDEENKRILGDIEGREDKLSEDIRTQQTKLLDIIKEQMSKTDIRLKALEGDTYRSFAYIHKENPHVSFLWWMRTAGAFTEGNEKELAAIAIKNAEKTLNEIVEDYQISYLSKQIKEVEELFKLLEKSYKLETDIVRNTFVRKLSERKKKEPEPPKTSGFPTSPSK